MRAGGHRIASPASAESRSRFPIPRQACGGASGAPAHRKPIRVAQIHIRRRIACGRTRASATHRESASGARADARGRSRSTRRSRASASSRRAATARPRVTIKPLPENSLRQSAWNWMTSSRRSSGPESSGKPCRPSTPATLNTWPCRLISRSLAPARDTAAARRRRARSHRASACALRRARPTAASRRPRAHRRD